MDKSKTIPTCCIDPVFRCCQYCEWGFVEYPDCVETYDDLSGCCFEEGCTLGFTDGPEEKNR